MGNWFYNISQGATDVARASTSFDVVEPVKQSDVMNDLEVVQSDVVEPVKQSNVMGIQR